MRAKWVCQGTIALGRCLPRQGAVRGRREVGGGITAEEILPWIGLLQEEKGRAAWSRPSYSCRLTM